MDNRLRIQETKKKVMKYNDKEIGVPTLAMFREAVYKSIHPCAKYINAKSFYKIAVEQQFTTYNGDEECLEDYIYYMLDMYFDENISSAIRKGAFHKEALRRKGICVE